jgi:hypothetical protein
MDDVRVALQSQRFGSGLHALYKTFWLTNQSSKTLQSKVKEVTAHERVLVHKYTDLQVQPNA